MHHKILHYLPYSSHIHTGGLEKIAQTIASGLAKDTSFSSKSIASDIRRGPGGELGEYPDTLFIPSFDLVYNFPFPKFWTNGFWQQFSYIRTYKPDVIITHTRFFIQSFLGGLLAKSLGCKRVHVEHGSGFVTGYPWYIRCSAWLFDWTIGVWIFRQCDQIVTISKMHTQFIKRFTKKEPVVIYNPIDYIPQPRGTNAVPHIGFIGRLVSLKGVDLLIHALKKLETTAWTCTIVGEGDQKKVWEALVDDLGLQDRITFVGADDRNNWLHMFDIFVNPSWQEGVPTTVIEALFARCIVVATDVGGTREISDEDDMILIESGTVDALTDAIVTALNSLSKSGSSYDKVIEKFGVDGAIQGYKKILYNNIAGEKLK